MPVREWRPRCETCDAAPVHVDDAMSMELNTRSVVCLCDVLKVHTALTAAGLAPLDAGGQNRAEPPVDDTLLRACGWPVTPALAYEAGDDGVVSGHDDNADDPPWIEAPASVWTRLYADAWAVDAARAMFNARGERARDRAVVVLMRGVRDPAFRGATRAVQRIAGEHAFVKALFAGARRTTPPT